MCDCYSGPLHAIECTEYEGSRDFVTFDVSVGMMSATIDMWAAVGEWDILEAQAYITAAERVLGAQSSPMRPNAPMFETSFDGVSTAVIPFGTVIARVRQVS